MLRALLAVLRAPARAVPSRALVRQGAAGSHRCSIPAAATWEEVCPGRCGCSVVNSFKLFRKLLKPVSASQLARSIDERHQRLAAATVAARSRTDRSQGARRSPVDRLVHRLCASLGLSLLCRSRVLGAVLQQLCSAAGLAQWPKQQDGNEGCGRAAGSSNAPPVPSLSHPLTVSTPAALFTSSASPVCSEPLLTHSIPNIQSLSPTTLRQAHPKTVLQALGRRRGQVQHVCHDSRGAAAAGYFCALRYTTEESHHAGEESSGRRGGSWWGSNR